MSGEQARNDEPSTEDRARLHGWHPEAEFRGDKTKWVPAEIFLDRMEQNTPVLRERLKALEQKAVRTEQNSAKVLEELKIVRENFGTVSGAFDEMREQAARAREQGYKDAEVKIKRQLADAARDGDEQAAVRAAEELERLGKQQAADEAKRAAPKPAGDQQGERRTAPVLTPYMQSVAAWRDSEERAWFRNDPGVAGYTEGEFAKVRRENPNGTADEHLAEIERRAREKFPEAFGDATPQRRRASVEAPAGAVNGGGSERKKGVDEQWAELPQDAKAAYERFAKSAKLTNPNKPYTREEYLRVYNGE